MKACPNENCSGILEIDSLKNHHGYLIATSAKCTKSTVCGFKKFSSPKHLQEHLNNTESCINFIRSQNFPPAQDNYKSILEHLVQFILGNFLFPNCQVLSVDTGISNNSYDFLVTSEDGSIAIEVAQATNENDIASTKFLAKHQYRFERPELNFFWTLAICSGTKLTTPKLIEEIAIILKSFEATAIQCGDSIISASDEKYFINENCKKLNTLGIMEFFATNTPQKSYKGIYFLIADSYCQQQEFTKLLSSISKVVSQIDIQKKLILARTNEKHLFIPLTQFMPAQANYLNTMKSTPIEVNLINFPSMIDNIDVIWIATLFNPGKAFNLAKIYKSRGMLILERITKDYIPYIYQLNSNE